MFMLRCAALAVVMLSIVLPGARHLELHTTIAHSAQILFICPVSIAEHCPCVAAKVSVTFDVFFSSIFVI